MLKGFTFPKSARLLRPRDFRTCSKYGKELRGRFLFLHVHTTDSNTKLGLTVSKRFGKAHHRNRFKRQMREAFRLSCAELPAGVHLNVRPRKAALGVSTAELQDELLAHFPKNL